MTTALANASASQPFPTLVAFSTPVAATGRSHGHLHNGNDSAWTASDSRQEESSGYFSMLSSVRTHAWRQRRRRRPDSPADRPGDRGWSRSPARPAWPTVAARWDVDGAPHLFYAFDAGRDRRRTGRGDDEDDDNDDGVVPVIMLTSSDDAAEPGPLAAALPSDVTEVGRAETVAVAAAAEGGAAGGREEVEAVAAELIKVRGAEVVGSGGEAEVTDDGLTVRGAEVADYVPILSGAEVAVRGREAEVADDVPMVGGAEVAGSGGEAEVTDDVPMVGGAEVADDVPILRGAEVAGRGREAEVTDDVPMVGGEEADVEAASKVDDGRGCPLSPGDERGGLEDPFSSDFPDEYPSDVSMSEFDPRRMLAAEEAGGPGEAVVEEGGGDDGAGAVITAYDPADSASDQWLLLKGGLSRHSGANHRPCRSGSTCLYQRRHERLMEVVHSVATSLGRGRADTGRERRLCEPPVYLHRALRVGREAVERRRSSAKRSQPPTSSHHPRPGRGTTAAAAAAAAGGDGHGGWGYPAAATGGAARLPGRRRRRRRFSLTHLDRSTTESDTASSEWLPPPFCSSSTSSTSSTWSSSPETSSGEEESIQVDRGLAIPFIVSDDDDDDDGDADYYVHSATDDEDDEVDDDADDNNLVRLSVRLLEQAATRSLFGRGPPGSPATSADVRVVKPPRPRQPSASETETEISGSRPPLPPQWPPGSGRPPPPPSGPSERPGVAFADIGRSPRPEGRTTANQARAGGDSGDSGSSRSDRRPSRGKSGHRRERSTAGRDVIVSRRPGQKERARITGLLVPRAVTTTTTMVRCERRSSSSSSSGSRRRRRSGDQRDRRVVCGRASDEVVFVRGPEAEGVEGVEGVEEVEVEGRPNAGGGGKAVSAVCAWPDFGPEFDGDEGNPFRALFFRAVSAGRFRRCTILQED
ncbi:unnamed protein product [Lampetra fluviatilis]